MIARAMACTALVLIAAATVLGQTESAPQGPTPIRIVQHQAAPEVLAYWQALKEERPPLRGYRAPLLDHASEAWPTALTPDAPAAIRAAADQVGVTLAREGLLRTTARAMQALGPGQFAQGSADSLDLLRRVGVPIDLLDFFRAPGQPEHVTTVQTIARGLLAGIAADDLNAWLDTFVFDFRPTRPGYAVSAECGEEKLDLVRLQLTRGSYWDRRGDGGNIDLTRQMIEMLPEVKFVLSIQDKHVNEFQSMLNGWSIAKPERIALISEPLIVAQWAQDNGKPGAINDATSGTRQTLTIVPRYASRGEEGSIFVPGETFLLDGLAAAGLQIIQSPLLFHGGDLLAMRDPAANQRFLLIGEAQVHRNIALGLAREQVLQAFQREFGVDRCEVLPAVSFHIDFELCARVHGGQLIAFVNDTPAAVRIILECGVGALETHKIITASMAQSARANLRDWNGDGFLGSIFNAVMSKADSRGNFPLSLAEAFSTGPADNAVGNFQRFLLAMDMLSSWSLPPGQGPRHPHAAAYLRSFDRRDRLRESMHRQLADLGFRVIAVPSMSDADRGINYINGIHDRARYLMPAWGGLYSPLDEAAKKAFEAALGNEIEVIPLVCSETQRRSGGVHCSASAYVE